jgi:hypothetical protein
MFLLPKKTEKRFFKFEVVNLVSEIVHIFFPDLFHVAEDWIVLPFEK